MGHLMALSPPPRVAEPSKLRGDLKKLAARNATLRRLGVPVVLPQLHAGVHRYAKVPDWSESAKSHHDL
jgi:hypothetical protein